MKWTPVKIWSDFIDESILRNPSLSWKQNKMNGSRGGGGDDDDDDDDGGGGFWERLDKNETLIWQNHLMESEKKLNNV